MTVELFLIGAWDNVVIESLSNMATSILIAFEFLVSVPWLVVEVLFDMVVGVLSVGIGVTVLAKINLNVSADVMTTLEFPIPIP